MISTIGDFFLKVVSYINLKKERGLFMEEACITKTDLTLLTEEIRKEKNDVMEYSIKRYEKARENFVQYLEQVKQIDNLLRTFPEEERFFISYAGERLKEEDVQYFVYQANPGALVEITEENVEQFVKDVEELGYQSYRYHEASNFVGTKETFEVMFDDFYRDFAQRKE